MIRTTIDLSEEMHRELKIYCAANGLKLVEVIRGLVAELLEKERKKLKIK